MNKKKFLKGQCDLFAFVPLNRAERFKRAAIKSREHQEKDGRRWKEFHNNTTKVKTINDCYSRSPSDVGDKVLVACWFCGGIHCSVLDFTPEEQNYH